MIVTIVLKRHLRRHKEFLSNDVAYLLCQHSNIWQAHVVVFVGIMKNSKSDILTTPTSL